MPEGEDCDRPLVRRYADHLPRDQAEPLLHDQPSLGWIRAIPPNEVPLRHRIRLIRSLLRDRHYRSAWRRLCRLFLRS